MVHYASVCIALGSHLADCGENALVCPDKSLRGCYKRAGIWQARNMLLESKCNCEVDVPSVAPVLERAANHAPPLLCVAQTPCCVPY